MVRLQRIWSSRFHHKTVVIDDKTKEVIADLVEHGQRAIIAKGGRGGRGNSRFATPANPAPEIAENGEPGQERDIVMELKLLADVGLVGFPSVGNPRCCLSYQQQGLKLPNTTLRRSYRAWEWWKRKITVALSWPILV